MYEILMLRLSEDKVYPMICNAMQTSEILEFVKKTEEKDLNIIKELIEVNFDCREVVYKEADPLNLKKPENKSSQKFIVYINHNNGGEQSLFGYPTLKHAYEIGMQFITKKSTVKIYKIDDSIEWGNLQLVKTLKYNKC